MQDLDQQQMRFRGHADHAEAVVRSGNRAGNMGPMTERVAGACRIELDALVGNVHRANDVRREVRVIQVEAAIKHGNHDALASVSVLPGLLGAYIIVAPLQIEEEVIVAAVRRETVVCRNFRRGPVNLETDILDRKLDVGNLIKLGRKIRIVRACDGEAEGISLC